MIGITQTLLWWLGEEGVKTTENEIHWPCWKNFFQQAIPFSEKGIAFWP
jgi:hypothetical protein